MDITFFGGENQEITVQWLGTGMEFGVSPFPVTVTTRIIPFLVGNPYKPSLATVTGKGGNPRWNILLGSLLGATSPFQKTWQNTSRFMAITSCTRLYPENYHRKIVPQSLVPQEWIEPIKRMGVPRKGHLPFPNIMYLYIYIHIFLHVYIWSFII